MNDHSTSSPHVQNKGAASPLGDGGPVYPCPVSDGHETGRDHGGLSIRDYFFAAALTGLLAKIEVDELCPAADVSRAASAIADAALVERDRSAAERQFVADLDKPSALAARTQLIPERTGGAEAVKTVADLSRED